MHREQTLNKLVTNRRLETQQEVNGFNDAVNQLYELEVDVPYVTKLIHLFNGKYGIVDPLEKLKDYITDGIDNAIFIEVIMRETGKIDLEWLYLFYGILLLDDNNVTSFKSMYRILPKETRAKVLDIFNHFLQEDFSDEPESTYLVENIGKPTKANIKAILDQ